MTYAIDCGDIFPGCPGHLESDDRDQLVQQVAAHAREAHGVTEITPEMADAVGAKIQQR